MMVVTCGNEQQHREERKKRLASSCQGRVQLHIELGRSYEGVDNGRG